MDTLISQVAIKLACPRLRRCIYVYRQYDAQIKALHSKLKGHSVISFVCL